MNKEYKIAVLPGDGIGPEVMLQAYKILDVVQRVFKITIIINEYDVGGVAIDNYGVALPNHTLLNCSQADAILFGSVGGCKWNNIASENRPESALLTLRKYFNLFANLRYVHLNTNLYYCSPLRSDIAMRGFDILLVRELTGGIYFGRSQKQIGEGANEYAFDTEIYYRFEIERIAHIAFQLARLRNKHVTSVDKANVLQSSIFWRTVVSEVSQYYPDVFLDNLYVDAAAMHLVQYPYKFDVILCSNMFGDILSDECAILSGSLGMLPSSSLNGSGFGLYEPAGGSAPDIAGKDIANPIAQILSTALLFRHSLKLDYVAEAIENAVKKALEAGYRTLDLSNNHSSNYVGTRKMGDIITSFI